MNKLLGGLLGSLALIPAAARAEAAAETVVVTASRAPEDLRTLAGSVIIIDRQDIDAIAEPGQNLGHLLTRLVPGMGPETNSVSNFGQQLQGRKVLILIDGIPQNENRQVSRQLNTIQLSSIQRVEVISGATAIYGSDAIGGAINVITRDYAAAPLQQETKVSASVSEQASLQEGGIWQLEHAVSGSWNNTHYLAGASIEKRGSSFDAQGDRIPPEPAQTSRDQVQAVEALVKLQQEFSDQAGLEVTANFYKDRQDFDYTVATDPYRTVDGLELAEQPYSERQQVALRYYDKSVLGQNLEAMIFQKSRTYRFFPFVLKDPFTVINQSTSLSRTLGARLQLDGKVSSAVRLIYGLDFEQEKGEQKARSYNYTDYYISQGLGYHPQTDFYDYGPAIVTEKLSPFLQGKWALDAQSHLQAGFRHECVQQTIDDFTPPLETAIALNYDVIKLGLMQLEQAGRLPVGTVAGLPATYQKAPYAGGKKSFEASAFNIGYSYNPDAEQHFFVNYAQAYELADTARLMRDAVAADSLLPRIASVLRLNVKSTTTADLNVETIATQSVNMGWDRRTKSMNNAVNVFFNQSDKIYRFNRDFSVDLLSQIQQVYGFETATDYRWDGKNAAGFQYAMAWGRYRAVPFGAADSQKSWLRLSPIEVNPPKLTLHGTLGIGADSSLRLQSTQIFAQKGSRRSDVMAIHGYSTQDLMLIHRWNESSSLRLGISNLLNRDYRSIFHQWAADTYGESSGAPAHGRRISFGYQTIF